jgi:hypothetical protein
MTGATYTNPTVAPVIDSIGVPEIRSAVQHTQPSRSTWRSPTMPHLARRSENFGAQSMRFGEFGASGRVTAYLSDYAELQKYSGNISSDLWLVQSTRTPRGIQHLAAEGEVLRRWRGR